MTNSTASTLEVPLQRSGECLEEVQSDTFHSLRRSTKKTGVPYLKGTLGNFAQNPRIRVDAQS